MTAKLEIKIPVKEWDLYDYREYAREEAGAYAGEYNLDAIAKKLRDKYAGARPSEDTADSEELTAWFGEHDTANVEAYADSLGRFSVYICEGNNVMAAFLYGLGRSELKRAAEDYVRFCLGQDPWYGGWDQSSYLVGEMASKKYKEDSESSVRVADLRWRQEGCRYGVNGDSLNYTARKFAKAVEDYADLQYYL